jgi:glycosyltransferase involved in cell wall biosynthesis
VTAVSVIVPFFNAARSLEPCLAGLLQQDEPEGGYEVLAVDNNSTDGSAALARGYPAVRLLSEPRQGAYAARNRGLLAAKGRLIAFTDPDCVPRRDWLRRLTEAMADPRAMVVMGRDRPAGPSLPVRLLGEYDHLKEAFVLASPDPTVYYGHTNNLMARRGLFGHLGLFDERRRGADVIFVHRALALYGTQAVRYAPDAVVDHLEIRSARVYFQKAFIYGRSGRRYTRLVRARPLRNGERWQVFRHTVRCGRLPALQAGLLFALLALGVGFYYLGWLSAAPQLTPARPVTPPPDPCSLRP